MSRPVEGECAPYYAGYIGEVPDGDIVQRLESQLEETLEVLGRVAPERETYRYADGKWTPRDIVGHLIDAERQFATRALSFARRDRTPLPGFDENEWARDSNAGQRPLHELADELRAVRASNVAFFRGLSEEAWDARGVASGNPFTVRALAWIIAGHELHHRAVLEDRYLS